jgi:hypothetical protein
MMIILTRVMRSETRGRGTRTHVTRGTQTIDIKPHMTVGEQRRHLRPEIDIDSIADNVAQHGDRRTTQLTELRNATIAQQLGIVYTTNANHMMRRVKLIVVVRLCRWRLNGRRGDHGGLSF